MSYRIFKPIGALVLGLGLSGCEPDDSAWLADAVYRFPVADSLVYGHVQATQSAQSRIGMLDLSGTAPQAELNYVSLPGAIAQQQARLGDTPGRLLLVHGRDGRDAPNTSLVALRADGDKMVVTLDGQLGNMTQSPQGDSVVLFGADGSSTLLSALKMVVVDLSDGVDSAERAVERSLDTVSDVEFQVHVSPPLTVEGTEARLAVVTASSTLTFIDIDRTQHPEVTVDLAGLGMASGLVDFVEFDGPGGRVYAKFTHSSELVLVDFVRDGSEGRLRPVLSTLPLPNGLKQAFRYERDGQPRLLLSGRAAEREGAVIVDPVTRHVTQIAGAGEWVQAYRPADNGSDTYALIAGRAQIGRIRLRDVEQVGALAARRMLAGGIAVSTGQIDADAGVAVLLHDGGGLSVVDLQAGRVTTRAGRFTLTDVSVDRAEGRLWLSTPGLEAVAYMDLATGRTDEVTLPAPVAQIVPMFSEGRLAVVHDNVWGHVSLVDAARPEEGAVTELVGFLAEGIAD